MDQDSFRQLLQSSSTGKTSQPKQPSRSQRNGIAVSKPKTQASNEPAFKPRKVKKSSTHGYRDRAMERRVGEGNDYAHVEAVLEDFERKNADNEDKAGVEAQRRYLGGDSAHSVLVKGLDFSLLEQNKARLGNGTEEDDQSLERAFEETSQSTVKKGRSRADIIRELKEKRARGGSSGIEKEEMDGIDEEARKKIAVDDEARKLEQAKKAGKFKPIGFQPVGNGGKVKKRKGDEQSGEPLKKKKKKRKGEEQVVKPIPATAISSTPDEPPTATSITEPPPAQVEDELAEDVDIFAGIGDYEDLDLDESDDNKSEAGELPPNTSPKPTQTTSGATSRRVNWFRDDDPELARPTSATEQIPPETYSSSINAPTRSQDGFELNENEEDGEEEEQPMRLQPLHTSTLPSIKDLLAMDDAAGGSGKWKNKGKAKKGKGGVEQGKEVDGETKKQKEAELRAERDYKRLKSYTDKKAKEVGGT